MKTKIATIALALLVAGSARAEVTDAQPNGFEVRRQVVIAAPAGAVWATLVQPSKWWASAHTWSGSAANLSLGAASGGCFCERLPNGGSALHMTTVNAEPGRKLVLVGALGPMQSSGASGALTGAALLWAGAPFWAAILLGMVGAGAAFILLRRYYGAQASSVPAAQIT